MRRALALAWMAALTCLAVSPIHAGAGSAGPQTVDIKTEDGLTLKGSFFVPEKGSRAPGVLLVHDAGGERSQLEPIAERLQKLGFGVLSFDLRGHGDSKTDKLNWETLSEDERTATWTFAQRDVDAATRWLLGQSSIHSTSLNLVGLKAGCALVARHARDDEKVVCVALIAPNPVDYGYDVEADLHTLEGLPTFVISAKNEAAERIAMEANEAFGGGSSVELLIVNPKDGNFPADKKVTAQIGRFMSDKAMPKKGGRRGR
jgi:dienelactone hydrolase